VLAVVQKIVGLGSVEHHLLVAEVEEGRIAVRLSKMEEVQSVAADHLKEEGEIAVADHIRSFPVEL
jgi:hypothetical protein